MELREFITTTLSEIAGGVSDAKSIYKGLGGEVAPKDVVYLEGVYYKSANPSPHSFLLSNVEFEVLLSKDDSKTTSKGIGVVLGSFDIGAKKNNENQITSTSKIKFTVPVILP